MKLLTMWIVYVFGVLSVCFYTIFGKSAEYEPLLELSYSLIKKLLETPHFLTTMSVIPTYEKKHLTNQLWASKYGREKRVEAVDMNMKLLFIRIINKTDFLEQ